MGASSGFTVVRRREPLPDAVQDPPSAAPAPRRARPWLLPVVAAGVAACLVGGVATFVVVSRGDEAGTAAPPVTAAAPPTTVLAADAGELVASRVVALEDLGARLGSAQRLADLVAIGAAAQDAVPSLDSAIDALPALADDPDAGYVAERLDAERQLLAAIVDLGALDIDALGAWESRFAPVVAAVERFRRADVELRTVMPETAAPPVQRLVDGVEHTRQMVATAAFRVAAWFAGDQAFREQRAADVATVQAYADAVRALAGEGGRYDEVRFALGEYTDGLDAGAVSYADAHARLDQAALERRAIADELAAVSAPFGLDHGGLTGLLADSLTAIDFAREGLVQDEVAGAGVALRDTPGWIEWERRNDDLRVRIPATQAGWESQVAAVLADIEGRVNPEPRPDV